MHYGYKVSREMDCENFAPWFLLYNGGRLNAFGFVDFGYLGNDYVENLPKNARLVADDIFEIA